MKHKESGRECMVAHYDEKGYLEPACIKCAICFKWIRPNDMEKECIPLKSGKSMPVRGRGVQSYQTEER